MKYNFKNKYSILFTLRESRCHPISGVYPPLAGCQGLAVNDYSFTLGRLEAGAPLQRRIFDLDFLSIRVILYKVVRK